MLKCHVGVFLESLLYLLTCNNAVRLMHNGLMSLTTPASDGFSSAKSSALPSTVWSSCRSLVSAYACIPFYQTALQSNLASNQSVFHNIILTYQPSPPPPPPSPHSPLRPKPHSAKQLSRGQEDNAGVFIGEQLRKGVGVSQDLSDYPAYFEDHQDYKDFCISYRGDLARIVKLTAGLLPDQALAAASRRLQNALHECSTSSTPPAVRYIVMYLQLCT